MFVFVSYLFIYEVCVSIPPLSQIPPYPFRNKLKFPVCKTNENFSTKEMLTRNVGDYIQMSDSGLLRQFDSSFCTKKHGKSQSRLVPTWWEKVFT